MAIDLMKQQRFAEALPILVCLTESNPNDWSLYYMAGQCCRFINDIPKALTLLNKAAILNPNEAQVFLALGIAHQLAEQYDLAIKALKQAVKIEPTLWTTYNSIGLTYRKLGEFRQALEYYSKASECLVENIIKELLKDREKFYREEIIEGKKILVLLPSAMEKTYQLLRLDPSYAIVMNNIGTSLIQLGEMDSAREKLKESIEFIPDGYEFSDPYENLNRIRD